MNDLYKNELLARFNKREEHALGEVYQMFYRDYFHYVSKMVAGSSFDAEDVIHDIFIAVWSNPKRSFDSIVGMKSYVYISVRNRLRVWAAKHKRMSNYLSQLDDDDLFTVQIAENEVVSLVAQSAEMLPDECAKVFRLHIEGWDIKEIALQLGKSESTVYKQKRQALSILKEKISKDKLLIIMSLFP